jgi:hypothetical protein
MATFVSEGTVDEVGSLSASQVRRLLDALELHHEMLLVGHEDAMRLLQEGLRPGYLLDFELIFRYMFRAEERPDWAQELQYLFSHEETTFLIGPGTRLEIDKFMEDAGFQIGADGLPEPRKRRRWRERGSVYGLDDSAINFGIYRLNELLGLANVKLWEDISDPNIDDEAFETAKAALDARRRGRAATDANLSDALNWAAVMYLRQNVSSSDVTFHPYLLTATKPLLNEKDWSREVVGPVSRRPSDAIYIEVLIQEFPDPAEAVDHTIQVAFEAATLERDLRRTPAYRNPKAHQKDPEFERAIEQNLVTDELRAQLQALSDFVKDRVITQTQRIYDNASLTTVSVTQQRGQMLPSLTRSPSKLFDLIVEVSAALNAQRAGSGLADLWDRALELTVQQHVERTTYELLDRGAGRRPLQYLVVERYTSMVNAETEDSKDDPEEPQYVLRWPSSLDAEEVLELFCRAFARHDATTVELTVGTDAGITDYGAELPIALKDLMGAIAEDECLQRDPEIAPKLRWIRMCSPDFDLYADVSPPDIAAEPVIGVFVERLNPEHLQDLYARTSARYLFPAWLERAIEAINDAA